MSALRRACARLLSLFRREALDREFAEEAQLHLDLAVEDYVRRGTPEAEARRLARIKFGAIQAMKDAHRDARGLPWLEGLFFDLRFALRGLRRDWAFSLAAITMLALAIGLNVTVFTVMDAMLFRGYPIVKRNDRLVYLQERSPLRTNLLSFADVEEWRAQAHAFEGIGYVSTRPLAFRDGEGRPIDMSASTVSANTFGLLRVPPMLGRDFSPEDETAGAPPVVILNYRFWEQRFAKRADVVGATVHIDGAPATVIGVMPERFDFPLPISDDFWMPVVRSPELQQRGIPGGFMAFGRLKDGTSRPEALAELETINRRLEADYPATNRGLVPTMVTHAALNSGPDAPMIWGSLWAAAWFVLLIACANLAHLTLVRTMGRWRDFATRMALGAGQPRMIRQIFAESVMLVCAAGAIGWWLTSWSVHQWEVLTASRYQVLDYTVDVGTLGYLIAISVTAAILCSLAPIGRVVQLGTGGALKGDARGVTQGLRGKHLAAALVAGQMALAIVLLSGAGVLVRSFVKIVSADTGVRDAEQVLVGRLRLPSDTYPSPATRVAYFDRLDAQLLTIPAVEQTSVANVLPAHGVNQRTFEIEGRPRTPGTEDAVQFLTIGTGYFTVVGAPVISGRDFNEGDRMATPRVAIVNESFVATYWPGEEPTGKRLRPVDRNQPGEWLTVMGIAPNIQQGDALRQQFKPLVYLPLRQNPQRVMFFLARTRASSEQVAQAVRAEIQRVDSDVTLEDFATLQDSFAFDRDFMDAEHSELGKHAKVAPAFAIIALLLSAVGLYAVITHSVSQRTKEIGVRMAIGAASHDIRRLIFGEGMRPVALGLMVGFAASLGVNRILQSQLVGVSPYDPVTLATAPMVLILVALLACQIPSRRAMRVDPAVALRHD
jgi:putative ABC transport system permease protein